MRKLLGYKNAEVMKGFILERRLGLVRNRRLLGLGYKSAGAPSDTLILLHRSF